ncbi:MAG TPA: hypothetical protein VH208_08415, partial [Myxococcaceae bacterium]|nr:hypothetical protein [Myxococcaceae bacterium]
MPAFARTRQERITEAQGLVRQALDVNDERSSDCQMELEHKLERLSRDLDQAQASDDALKAAYSQAMKVREASEDDCPSDITRSVVPLVDRAIRILRRTVELAREDDESELYNPPQPPPDDAPPPDGDVAVDPVEAPPPAISVDIEPPIEEPPPIEVAWAPPPMLVEVPPPQPDYNWFWVGGFWTWQGQWVWVHGHWRQPPRVGYTWCQPYYENRSGLVVFISGHWRPEGSVFVPPAPNAVIVRVQASAGVRMGPRPSGPNGVFIPAPPGSRPGIIVSAPVGTPPAVVTSAPPVLRPGMRIEGHVAMGAISPRANLTVVAPAGVTKMGVAVNTTVPAAAHLAAARPPVVRAAAPAPMTTRPLPVFNPKQPPPQLPVAQRVETKQPVRPLFWNPNARPT